MRRARWRKRATRYFSARGEGHAFEHLRHRPRRGLFHQHRFQGAQRPLQHRRGDEAARARRGGGASLPAQRPRPQLRQPQERLGAVRERFLPQHRLRKPAHVRDHQRRDARAGGKGLFAAAAQHARRRRARAFAGRHAARAGGRRTPARHDPHQTACNGADEGRPALSGHRQAGILHRRELDGRQPRIGRAAGGGLSARPRLPARGLFAGQRARGHHRPEPPEGHERGVRRGSAERGDHPRLPHLRGGREGGGGAARPRRAAGGDRLHEQHAGRGLPARAAGAGRGHSRRNGADDV